MTNDVITDNTLIATLTVEQLKKIVAPLRAMVIPTSVQSSDKEIMNLEEVVRLTDYSKSTIYKLVHQRKIPFYKPAHGGRKLYFRRKEVSDWLQGQRIPAIEQEDKKCARKLCRR